MYLEMEYKFEIRFFFYHIVEIELSECKNMRVDYF